MGGQACGPGGTAPPPVSFGVLRLLWRASCGRGRLGAGGRCLLKLSAPSRWSRRAPPGSGGVAPRVRALAKDDPERCLWASNWPHPNIRPTPSNDQLLEWALRNMGYESARRQILVDNPALLYGFA